MFRACFVMLVLTFKGCICTGNNSTPAANYSTVANSSVPIQTVIVSASSSMLRGTMGSASNVSSSGTENTEWHASTARANMSDDEMKQYLVGWLKQSGFRTSLLEAWTPGSKAPKKSLDHDANASLPDLNLAKSQTDAAGFNEWWQNVRHWFQKNVVNYDNPLNYRQHPFRSRESSKYCVSPSSWKVWTPRRRRVCKYKVDEFNNEVCPNTPESSVTKLFSAKYLNGCSGPVPLPFHNVLTPVCMAHDICYACGAGVDGAGENTMRNWCDNQFFLKVVSECHRKLSVWSGQIKICVSFAGVIRGAHYYFAAGHYNPGRNWYDYDGKGIYDYQGACKSQCAVNAYKYGMEHLKDLDHWFPSEHSWSR